jgi:hypothetical protein
VCGSSSPPGAPAPFRPRLEVLARADPASQLTEDELLWFLEGDPTVLRGVRRCRSGKHGAVLFEAGRKLKIPLPAAAV